MRDPNQGNQCKGFGFVTFAEKSSGDQAILMLNGQQLGRKPLQIRWKTDNTAQKQHHGATLGPHDAFQGAPQGGGFQGGRGGRGGRGQGRGGRGSRGGAQPSSSGTQSSATGGTTRRGTKHPDLPPGEWTGCNLHFRWGRSAYFCAEPSTCPWRDIFTPRPPKKNKNQD